MPEEKRSHLPGILAALGIGGAEFLLTFLLYLRVRSGDVISARDSSGQPAAFLLQCLAELLFPAALLILSALLLKKDFASGMLLTLRGKWQRVTAAALAAAILGITGYCLAVKEDKVSVLLSLPYYLLAVAFAEEFVIRDAGTFLLRDAPWPLRYLLPNALFAMLHLFLYAGWGEITGETLLGFLFNGAFLGYVLGGCLIQLLMEKSGTLWLPVLLHCLMDYTSVLNY